MVSSVSQNPITTKTSIFYVNDIHGQVPKMERIKTASDQFDSFTPQEKTDKLKLSSGDTMLGSGIKENKAIAEFLKIIGINATAVGNHECDIPPEMLMELTKNHNYKLLGLNANIVDNNPWNGKILKSYIQEIDGNKYGIMGIMPSDIFLRIKNPENFAGITVDEWEQTIKEVQQEADNLKQQGVNKIILLSHGGHELEKRIAQETSGIDVIIGGHSHDLIKGVEEGKNLFYSKITGEPVVITQAGKDGNNFGILNLEFNQNGVIKQVQNNVQETKSFSKNAPMKYFFDTIIGKSEKVGFVSKAYDKELNRLAEENPNASFLADAIKSELKTDIALINASNMRGEFVAGDVYTRDITSLTPFKDKMTIVELTEKEIVEALKFGAKSLTKSDFKPGIMQVAGIRYKINKAGELLEARIIDRYNKETIVDINNPSVDKKYTAGMHDFLTRGGDGYSMLDKRNSALARFDFDKDKCAIDYIKKAKGPVEIQLDGRIQIVD